MTEQQYDTFSKFGKSFQEKLVKTILFDRNFTNQMEEVLDEDKFVVEFTHSTIKSWKGLTLDYLQTLLLIDGKSVLMY